jgi:hypothetical protein
LNDALNNQPRSYERAEPKQEWKNDSYFKSEQKGKYPIKNERNERNEGIYRNDRND